jgi:hypothetical protein
VQLEFCWKITLANLNLFRAGDVGIIAFATDIAISSVADDFKLLTIAASPCL